jgi:hypothetical protein
MLLIVFLPFLNINIFPDEFAPAVPAWIGFMGYKKALPEFFQKAFYLIRQTGYSDFKHCLTSDMPGNNNYHIFTSYHNTKFITESSVYGISI